jgi:hypothetical protein
VDDGRHAGQEPRSAGLVLDRLSTGDRQEPLHRAQAHLVGHELDPVKVSVTAGAHHTAGDGGGDAQADGGDARCNPLLEPERLTRVEQEAP